MVKKEMRTAVAPGETLLPGLTARQHGAVDENGVLAIGSGTETGTPNFRNVVISAGVPYLIKPNLPNNAIRQFRVFKDGQEAQKLRDQYAAANKELDVIIIVSSGLYDRLENFNTLSGKEQIDLVEHGKYTVPVFVSGDNITETTDGAQYTIAESPYMKSTGWYYTFVGSFYQSFMPHYCYYLGWDSDNNCAKFWYHNGNFDWHDNNMNWNNETGVICPTKTAFSYEVTPASGSGENTKPAQWIINGLEDDSFTTASGTLSKTYDMLFDSEDVFGDSFTTVIEGLDGNVDMVMKADNVKVYNVEGQYVGNTLKGLSKGLYIVNGKKFVVK